MNVAWNEEKNQFQINTRGISFEIVEELIRDDSIILEPHPDQGKYPGQIIIIFNYDNCWWVCPAVELDDGFFLKTIYPSRKITFRLPKEDLIGLKARARHAGIDYQPLLAALIHKYVKNEIKIEL